jgi:beta-galactosidase
VQSQADANSPIILRAQSAGLGAGETTITVNPAAAPAGIAAAQPTYILLKWRMSPSSITPPDPNQQIASNDQNTWQEVWTDKLRPFPNGNFGVFRTTFEPFHMVRKSGGRIHFTAITGKAEVWLDGKNAGNKDTFEPGPLTVKLPPGEGMRTLSLLIETRPGKPAGMDRTVTVEPSPSIAR